MKFEYLKHVFTALHFGTNCFFHMKNEKNFRLLGMVSLLLVCATRVYACENVEIVLASKKMVLDSKEKIKNTALRAFKTVYKDQWNDNFEKSGLEKIDSLIDQYQAHKDDMFWVLAQNKNDVAGWALFLKDNQRDERAIINQIAVDPDLWRQGIGKKLAFSIFKYWKTCTNIALTTRKSNARSHAFYKAIGFKESDFMPESDKGKDMQGYEYFAEH